MSRGEICMKIWRPHNGMEWSLHREPSSQSKAEREKKWVVKLPNRIFTELCLEICLFFFFTGIHKSKFGFSVGKLFAIKNVLLCNYIVLHIEVVYLLNIMVNWFYCSRWSSFLYLQYMSPPATFLIRFYVSIYLIIKLTCWIIQ